MPSIVEVCSGCYRATRVEWVVWQLEQRPQHFLAARPTHATNACRPAPPRWPLPPSLRFFLRSAHGIAAQSFPVVCCLLTALAEGVLWQRFLSFHPASIPNRWCSSVEPIGPVWVLPAGSACPTPPMHNFRFSLFSLVAQLLCLCVPVSPCFLAVARPTCARAVCLCRATHASDL